MIEPLRRVFGIVACATMVAATGCGAGSAEDTSGEDSSESEDALRVCADGETVAGIDVSRYQETIDWHAVKQSGKEFAFIRVSDGLNHPDSKFETNWAGAKDAGLLRGAYQFFRPAQSAEAQADLMIDAIGVLGAGDLPAVIDVESADGQSSATIVKKVRAWVQRVEAATGRTPIIYAASGFWNTLSGTSEFAAYPLWVANYTTKCPSMPATWGDWQFWQYSESGSVAGVPGNVDVNVFNGSLADLQAIARADLEPMGVSWTRQSSGLYDIGAEAAADVVRVDYFVDNYQIGSATRDAGDSFPDTYKFNVETTRRLFEARGFDSGDKQIARGIGLIDSHPGTAVFIRQLGEATYEIGMERAPAEVAAVEVTADGFLLTDGVSGSTKSSRLAVQSTFSQLGKREFAISTFNADGSKRGTLYRTFTLE
jgi:lysozyme